MSTYLSQAIDDLATDKMEANRHQKTQPNYSSSIWLFFLSASSKSAHNSKGSNWNVVPYSYLLLLHHQYLTPYSYLLLLLHHQYLLNQRIKVFHFLPSFGSSRKTRSNQSYWRYLRALWRLIEHGCVVGWRKAIGGDMV